MSGASTRILWLPDWQPAGQPPALPSWVQRAGGTLVMQHDWVRPLRGDWQMQLEQAVLEANAPVCLLAQGLGCHLVAAWAAHSRHTAGIQGALLLGPCDLGEPALQARLPSWVPPARQRLPFAARVVTFTAPSLPACEAVHTLAHDWGAALAVDTGSLGDVGPANWQRLRASVEQTIVPGSTVHAL